MADHPRLNFAAIGLDHRHILDMVRGLLDIGAECAGFWSRNEAVSLADFVQRFPAIRRVDERCRLLEDPSIQLVVSAAIPFERAGLAIEVSLFQALFVSLPPARTGLRPYISQGFGCMPCKKRGGLSGPMGISSKLIICALHRGSLPPWTFARLKSSLPSGWGSRHPKRVPGRGSWSQPIGSRFEFIDETPLDTRRDQVHRQCARRRQFHREQWHRS
jgi:hypothetical protein